MLSKLRITKNTLLLAIILLVLAAIWVVPHIFSRNDRLINDNLMLLQSAVENHATDYKKLPASIKDIDLSNDRYAGVRNMLAQTDVTYVPDTKPKAADAASTTYGYKLCATYRNAKTNGNGSHNYIYDANHPSGHYCYELQVITYPG